MRQSKKKKASQPSSSIYVIRIQLTIKREFGAKPTTHEKNEHFFTTTGRIVLPDIAERGARSGVRFLWCGLKLTKENTFTITWTC